MSAFSEFKAFSKVPGTEISYVLDAPLIWDIGREGSSWQMIIPAGTTFDISVPRLARWYLSPDDRVVLPCAALHDQLLYKDFDRPFASAEFRRAALSRGTRPFRAWVLFWSTLVYTVITQRNAERVRIERKRDTSPR
ncbi:MAG: DUF1353 domain-containing protein [Hyphomicrobiaceae bacterium]|nr:DUF1353 domain-containing protein [Hyphomicrobiaceae bacterium]